MPVVVVASLTAKPESVETVLEILTKTVAEVHTEPGCDRYALHRRENTFVFIEQWADAEALRAHGSAPAVTGMFTQLRDHLDGPPEMKLLEPVPAGDPAKGRLAP
ncbi:putative quinol monooxygenase [Mycobacterium sp. 1274756.6]|uniref:putative quinol monooxygenase n=1 Tax=Mycobacterium sp. 1274756.6 TaxID=1834076 RepID=UPI0007FBFD7F|nr:putative quinol monooxygenase [Mycobacterium sp. 1274756.6]OBJ67683.1 antibiotic biosynthesis monooxygenase [Mycobacterium sp. 1274756.6]